LAAPLRIGACLSLSGRFARFGQQAAHGLDVWRSLDSGVDVLVEDDRSDRRELERVLPGVARRSDLLLGPYSTVLMRAAGRLAAEHGWLVWNHGGSGDDVEGAHPGHVVSVLTPASQYARPFLRLLAGPGVRGTLVIAHGAGSFGRQVADGAEESARQLGIETLRVQAGDALPSAGLSGGWDLFTAGVFEDDAELVATAMRLKPRPRRICAVAAGVREFSAAVGDPEGAFGIAQWLPGSGHEALIGPSEDEFVTAYPGGAPDYPAAQAVASAVIAAHCARAAGTTRPAELWSAAVALDTATFFGAYRIDPASGAQTKHQTVLVRWAQGQPVPVGPLTVPS
jgi:ABC-type branched-subunit amino acid transport system substrate-binding protein